MTGTIRTATVDPLNFPAVRDGKPRARLWFLMMNSTALDCRREDGMLLLEMAKELERRVEAGRASAAERAVFDQAYAAFRPEDK